MRRPSPVRPALAVLAAWPEPPGALRARVSALDFDAGRRGRAVVAAMLRLGGPAREDRR